MMKIIHTYYTNSLSDPCHLIRMVTPEDFDLNPGIRWTISEVETWSPATDSFCPASSIILSEIAHTAIWKFIDEDHLDSIKQNILNKESSA